MFWYTYTLEVITTIKLINLCIITILYVGVGVGDRRFKFYPPSKEQQYSVVNYHHLLWFLWSNEMYMEILHNSSILCIHNVLFSPCQLIFRTDLNLLDIRFCLLGFVLLFLCISHWELSCILETSIVQLHVMRKGQIDGLGFVLWSYCKLGPFCIWIHRGRLLCHH